MNKFTDLVIAGPDFSGTSTQVEDIVQYFFNSSLKVRDIKGTEFDALFHAEKFKEYNKPFVSLEQFKKNSHPQNYANIILDMSNMINGIDYNRIRVASMIENDVTEFVDPNSADVWIMEEPTYRGAGQVARSVETNRSKFDSSRDQLSTALTIQSDRVNEYLRFRKPLREAGKIIVRSRSEESACYQIFDEKLIPNGVKLEDYIEFPGNKIAFQNPPTDIFVVCGPQGWKKQDYLALKNQRVKNRRQDDFEKDVDYQLLVNERYATSWLEDTYSFACSKHGSKIPKIHRFDIYNNILTTKEEMLSQLENVISYRK